MEIKNDIPDGQITIKMRYDQLPDPVRKDFLNDIKTKPTRKIKELFYEIPNEHEDVNGK